MVKRILHSTPLARFTMDRGLHLIEYVQTYIRCKKTNVHSHWLFIWCLVALSLNWRHRIPKINEQIRQNGLPGLFIEPYFRGLAFFVFLSCRFGSHFALFANIYIQWSRNSPRAFLFPSRLSCGVGCVLFLLLSGSMLFISVWVWKRLKLMRPR